MNGRSDLRRLAACSVATPTPWLASLRKLRLLAFSVGSRRLRRYTSHSVAPLTPSLPMLRKLRSGACSVRSRLLRSLGARRKKEGNPPGCSKTICSFVVRRPTNAKVRTTVGDWSCAPSLRDSSSLRSLRSQDAPPLVTALVSLAPSDYGSPPLRSGSPSRKVARRPLTRRVRTASAVLPRS